MPNNFQVMGENNNVTHQRNMSVEEIEIYLNSFPPGYKFDPSDEELIMEYLLPKIKGQILPINLMHDVNIYKHNPDHLAEEYKAQGNKGWYFFTSRDKKYKNGQRPNRRAGDGFWKATGADKDIYKNEIKVGSRKALVFYKGRPPKGKKTLWIMHEFRVEGPPCVTKRHISTSHNTREYEEEYDTSMRLDDFILCRIYQKSSGLRKKNAQAEEEGEKDGNEVETEVAPEDDTSSMEDKVSPPVDNNAVMNNPSNNVSMYNTNNIGHDNVNVYNTNNHISNENVIMYSTSNNISDGNVNMYNTRNNIGDDNVNVYNTNNHISNDNVNMYNASNHNNNVNVYNANNNIGNANVNVYNANNIGNTNVNVYNTSSDIGNANVNVYNTNNNIDNANDNGYYPSNNNIYVLDIINNNINGTITNNDVNITSNTNNIGGPYNVNTTMYPTSNTYDDARYNNNGNGCIDNANMYTNGFFTDELAANTNLLDMNNGSAPTSSDEILYQGNNQDPTIYGDYVFSDDLEFLVYCFLYDGSSPSIEDPMDMSNPDHDTTTTTVDIKLAPSSPPLPTTTVDVKPTPSSTPPTSQ